MWIALLRVLAASSAIVLVTTARTAATVRLLADASLERTALALAASAEAEVRSPTAGTPTGAAWGGGGTLIGHRMPGVRSRRLGRPGAAGYPCLHGQEPRLLS